MPTFAENFCLTAVRLDAPRPTFGITVDVDCAEAACSFAEAEGITLRLASELAQCGLAVPENLAEIEQWVRTARGM